MSDNRGPIDLAATTILGADNRTLPEPRDAPESCLPASVTSAPTALDRAGQQARTYLLHAKADSTLRAYRNDWADFTRWCMSSGCMPLPAEPETVALYLAARAETCKVSTLRRRVAAISQAHQAAGIEVPPTRSLAVRSVLSGICRVHGAAQEGKAPAVTDELRAMVDTLPKTLLGARDRALLLLGFAGAFRRSELVSLDVADLEWRRDGLAVTLRRSKTDQEATGALKGIPYGDPKGRTCPCRAVKAWLKASGIETGPVFRSVNRHGALQAGRLSDKAVALVVKRAALAAGLDPARYSGHSLRAGFATSAAEAGVEERDIQRQTGHRSVSVLRGYIRSGSLFRGNAAGQVGL